MRRLRRRRFLPFCEVVWVVCESTGCEPWILFATACEARVLGKSNPKPAERHMSNAKPTRHCRLIAAESRPPQPRDVVNVARPSFCKMPLIQRKRRAVSTLGSLSQEARLTITSSNPKKKTRNLQTTHLSLRRKGEGNMLHQKTMHSTAMAALRQTVVKIKW